MEEEDFSQDLIFYLLSLQKDGFVILTSAEHSSDLRLLHQDSVAAVQRDKGRTIPQLAGNALTQTYLGPKETAPMNMPGGREIRETDESTIRGRLADTLALLAGATSAGRDLPVHDDV